MSWLRSAGHRRDELFAEPAGPDGDRHEVVGETGVVERLRGELRAGLPAHPAEQVGEAHRLFEVGGVQGRPVLIFCAVPSS